MSSDQTIDRLRGQLQNCVNHLDGVKRRYPSRSDTLDACIESANKALYETLHEAIPDTHRVVPVDALNRIMELAGVALVYQPFGTKDRQHFDALMAIIEDKP